MTDTEQYNCVYCGKRYKNRGWLASHISKKHDDYHQLEKDMTVLRDNAADIRQKEAENNLSDEPAWQTNVPDGSLGSTSTPRAAAPVPLHCVKNH